MGNLQRRYWHLIGTAAEMRERWTKRIRLLGEDLVLFRDRSGRLGLIAEICPHRRASLAYGIPTEDGIRCPYHGWKFDGGGNCLEQPNEPEGSVFKEKIKTAGYPVEELAGMLWAYLGPLPAPLVPRLDAFVSEGTIHTLGYAVIPCNWLQIMENSVDAVHTEWLHGALYEFVKEKEGVKVAISRHHKKYGFDEFEYGIIKRRVLEGFTESADDWKIGHPLVFPNTLASGNDGESWKEYRLRFAVPIDDTHTLRYWYSGYVPPRGVAVPPELLDRVHFYEIPYLDEHGEFRLDEFHAQDVMAWVMQGEIADRTLENIAVSDKGVTLYRKMLMRELKRMEEGEDPKNVIRDPEKNTVINLPVEKVKSQRADGFERVFRRNYTAYIPVAEQILALYAGVIPEPVLVS
jgi:5,5'-dehydrodivanillate O-demethylase